MKNPFREELNKQLGAEKAQEAVDWTQRASSAFVIRLLESRNSRPAIAAEIAKTVLTHQRDVPPSMVMAMLMSTVQKLAEGIGIDAEMIDSMMPGAYQKLVDELKAFNAVEEAMADAEKGK